MVHEVDNAISLVHEFYITCRNEIRKYVMLPDSVIDAYVVSLLAGGHILLVGPPGVAKTRSARVVSGILGLDFSRLQFTADLLPSDIIGAETYNPKMQEFFVRKGPIFHGCVLVDELNRAPAKVQSALLEAMEEKQVTIAGSTFELPDPFFVIATMNPHDGIGTYTLPEATYDRFLMCAHLEYPQLDEEKRILAGDFREFPGVNLANSQSIQQMKEIITKNVLVDIKIVDYIARIMKTIRTDTGEYLTAGVSLRVSLGLLHSAKVYAACMGRDFVLPDDVKRFVYPILNHRLHLSFKAVSQGVSVESYVASVIDSTPLESV